MFTRFGGICRFHLQCYEFIWGWRWRDWKQTVCQLQTKWHAIWSAKFTEMKQWEAMSIPYSANFCRIFLNLIHHTEDGCRRFLRNVRTILLSYGVKEPRRPSFEIFCSVFLLHFRLGCTFAAYRVSRETQNTLPIKTFRLLVSLQALDPEHFQTVCTRNATAQSPDSIRGQCMVDLWRKEWQWVSLPSSALWLFPFRIIQPPLYSHLYTYHRHYKILVTDSVLI